MSQPSAAAATGIPALPPILDRAASLMSTRDNEGAIALLLSAQHLLRNEPVACKTLGLLLLQVERSREAVRWLDRALSIAPGDRQALVNLGLACQTIGHHARALDCYAEALALEPDDAETWYNYGLVHSELRRLAGAIACFDRALALKPAYPLAFTKRTHLLAKLGDMTGAVRSAMARCRAAPDDIPAWLLLGDLLQEDQHPEQAILAYDHVLKLSPGNFQCLCNKAQALDKASRKDEALAVAKAALAAKPADREALLLNGNLELARQNHAAAESCFIEVAKLGAARQYAAAQWPPKFRMRLLFSPFGGNTPYEDLISGGGYDTDLSLVLSGHRDDPETMKTEADIFFNLISDVDRGHEGIAPVRELVAALGKPVINHPDLVMATDRETVAHRLHGIAGLNVPMTRRVEADALRQALPDGCAMRFPLIARHAGTHGGEMMELVDDVQALHRFAEEAGDQTLYLTEYVDYRSPDDFFRKYRFVFVGEEILPYHLAIGDVWKVHHATTPMAGNEWMRDEEEAFLNAPELLFGPGAMAALQAVRREIGLDYFGIDCSLDRAGGVIVFEVNASMLIHLQNEGFEYKTPHVMRIKAAFERMLEERVKRR